MDPGYSPVNRQKIEYNATLLHVPITVFETNIFGVANNTSDRPLPVCRMRRGHLAQLGQRTMGCNKIALGHHFNDVIETTVARNVPQRNHPTMLPKPTAPNFAGMELILMCCIHEEEHHRLAAAQQVGLYPMSLPLRKNCASYDAGAHSGRRSKPCSSSKQDGQT